MKCDVDLVFNEKMQYCDWEHNVDRCSGLDTTTPSEATTPEEEATTTVEETTTQEEETTTEKEENCKYWYKYDLESENYHFDSCTEATEDDFFSSRQCNRVKEDNDILEPGDKFKFEGYSDGNCFGFHQCIKFCESMVHKCIFKCNCMENDEGVMMRGVYDYAASTNDTACFRSFHQECFNDEIGQDACTKKMY